MKERKYYIDVIRIIAVILVVMNHTNSTFYKFNDENLITWSISTIIFFISKAAVPLFIMITGALTLGKEQSYKKILQKLSKTLILIVIWSFIYFIYVSHFSINLKEIVPFIKSIINKPYSTHFWYLYMLAGLYVMMPFLQKMIKEFRTIDFTIFLTIWFVFTSLLPFLRIFKVLTYTDFFSIPLFMGYSGFLVLGYFITKIDITKKVIYYSVFSLVVSLILTFIVTYHFSLMNGKTSAILDNVSMFPIVIISASTFILIKHQYSKNNKIFDHVKFTKGLLNLSKATFGIYLIHILLASYFINGVIYNSIYKYSLNPIIGFVIWDIFIILISYISIVILGKIPYLKKIVYF